MKQKKLGFLEISKFYCLAIKLYFNCECEIAILEIITVDF